MFKKIALIALLNASFCSPAFAVNTVLNMKNRLKTSLNASHPLIKKTALKKLCKKKDVKTKSCFVQYISQKKDYALVTVDKKGRVYFGLFHFKNNKWHLRIKGPQKKMTVKYMGHKRPTMSKALLQDMVGELSLKLTGKN